MLDVKIVNVL